MGVFYKPTSLGDSLKRKERRGDVPQGHDFVQVLLRGKSTPPPNWQFLTIPGVLQISVWAFVNWLHINEEHLNKKEI